MMIKFYGVKYFSLFLLSVWKTWDIENRTFSSMVMVHGDNCQGNLDRQVKVNKYTLTHFMPLALSIPPENINNQRFSDTIRGYRKRPVA